MKLRKMQIFPGASLSPLWKTRSSAIFSSAFNRAARLEDFVEEQEFVENLKQFRKGRDDELSLDNLVRNCPLFVPSFN
ncbi:MAG: hypothetical protein ACREEM_12320 [Blastocatellia bacterium]